MLQSEISAAILVRGRKISTLVQVAFASPHLPPVRNATVTMG
jgi:hypothetical protein